MTQSGQEKNEITFEQVLEVVRTPRTARPERVQAMSVALNAHIAAGKENTTSIKKSKPALRIGAWIALAAAIVIGFSYNSLRNIPPAIPKGRVYSTNSGQRATVTLASGAQVTLAPATTLTVSGNEAILSGQAVFTVLHKSSAPFTVKTNTATVRVLGTTFGVRSYANDKETQIVVAEGKVSANQVVLSTGDAANVSVSGQRVQHGIDISTALSWTSGRLSFNETPFLQAIPNIERWYNVKIDVQDNELYSRRITTSLREGSMHEAIELLSAALKAMPKQNGNTITFHSNR